MSADGEWHRHRPEAAPGALPHGGDIAAAEARYGRPAAGWLDLSTGINPCPYPTRDLRAGDFARLPQPDAAARLAATARAYFAMPEEAALVPAPGTQALIQWLPRLTAPRRVAIVAPTYEEHERAWRLAGHEVRRTDELAAGASDILVLANPNNPDGRRFAPAELIACAQGLASRGGLLVVDEAFADCDPALSVIAATGQPGLLVLRSFGKFFGLAGLRLGFAACAPELGAQLTQALGPWPVSGPALAVAATAYQDRDWIAATRQRLARDAARRDRLLAGHGLQHLGGCDLFGLYALDSAADLADHLGRAGILVRRFTAEPRWLRFGLPGRANDWRRLAAALAGFAKETSHDR